MITTRHSPDDGTCCVPKSVGELKNTISARKAGAAN